MKSLSCRIILVAAILCYTACDSNQAVTDLMTLVGQVQNDKKLVESLVADLKAPDPSQPASSRGIVASTVPDPFSKLYNDAATKQQALIALFTNPRPRSAKPADIEAAARAYEVAISGFEIAAETEIGRRHAIVGRSVPYPQPSVVVDRKTLYSALKIPTGVGEQLAKQYQASLQLRPWSAF